MGMGTEVVRGEGGGGEFAGVLFDGGVGLGHYWRDVQVCGVRFGALNY